ncbi:hypothetical protein THOM_2131 [Trachipleistophora hominis]|uniref:Uncharacterized protein n=1 Tax=Trachipleistophora hominis TaxID=72359 RepID=L7JW07_TRAHO|nr:hypothetical protein THOM_2131 [Trachipleistophora hominis]
MFRRYSFLFCLSLIAKLQTAQRDTTDQNEGKLAGDDDVSTDITFCYEYYTRCSQINQTGRKSTNTCEYEKVRLDMEQCSTHVPNDQPSSTSYAVSIIEPYLSPSHDSIRCDLFSNSRGAETSEVLRKNEIGSNKSRNDIVPQERISYEETVLRSQRIKTSDQSTLKTALPNDIKFGDIRSIGSEYRNSASRLKLFKHLYYNVLQSTWHVIYGYYESGASNSSRFYIQHDRELFFMKSWLYLSNSKRMLGKQIFSSIRIICQRHEKHMVKNSSTIRRYDKIWRSSNPSIVIRRCNRNYVLNHKNVLWMKKQNKAYFDKHTRMYKMRKCDKKYDLMPYFNELHNIFEEEGGLNAVSVRGIMHYLLSNANRLFRIIAINPAGFVTIVKLNIEKIVANQLQILLNSRLSTKLLLFPELLSFRQYSYNINVERRRMGVHKLYISYYVMCKFEVLVQFFEKTLEQKGWSKKSAREPDMLFYTMYTREFFLIYIFNNIFLVKLPCIITYISLCRMQFVLFFNFSQEDSCKLTGDFVEFLLLNFVDVLSFFDSESFVKFCANIPELDAETVIHVAIYQLILKHICCSQKALQKLVKRFLVCIKALTPSALYGSLCKTILDDLCDERFSLHNHSAISNWIDHVNSLVLQSRLL